MYESFCYIFLVKNEMVGQLVDETKVHSYILPCFTQYYSKSPLFISSSKFAFPRSSPTNLNNRHKYTLQVLSLQSTI